MGADRALPGTSYNVRAGKWQARIAVEGVRKHLGYFATQEEAHEAYSAAKGERAKAKTEERVKSAGASRRSAGGPSAPVLPDAVMADLLAPGFVDMLGGTAAEALASEEFAQAVALARRERVDVYTVSDLAVAVLDDFDTEVTQMLASLRKAHALSRASEVIDRMFKAGSPCSFADAVREVQDRAMAEIADLI